MMINGSEESGIDVLRTKIKNFASTVSFNGRKYLILDEADYLNPQSTQPALRGFIEEFSSNCRFILTCNFKNRIIEPLHSRCSVIEFNTTKKQLGELCAQSSLNILKKEDVEFDAAAVAGIVNRHFPDWRRVVNELQRYSVSGKIDAGILVNLSEEKLTPLIDNIKGKNWSAMRKWVGSNSDNDFNTLFRKVFNALEQKLEPQSIPAAVLIIADYQYKAAFAMDSEINFVACLTEIMGECKFK